MKSRLKIIFCAINQINKKKISDIINNLKNILNKLSESFNELFFIS